MINDMGTQFYLQQQHNMNPMICSTGSTSSTSAAAAAPLFTSGQWAEFAHQDLIFKYMMAGLNVPQELVNPMIISCRSSSTTTTAASHAAAAHASGHAGLQQLINGMVTSSSSSSCHNFAAANLRSWGPMIIQRGAGGGVQISSNGDPEPGRCRRTDGKKWRCGRDVVPEQKYCEKHVHRGRHRPRPSRSNVADQQPGSSSTTATVLSSSGAAGAAAAPAAQLLVSGTTNVGPIRNSSSSSSASTPCTSAACSSAYSTGTFFQQQQQRPASASSDYNLSVNISKSFSSSLISSCLEPASCSPSGSTAIQETFGSSCSTPPRAAGLQISNLSRLQSVNQSWHSLVSSSKAPAPAAATAAGHTSSSSGGSSPQLSLARRAQFLGQDFNGSLQLPDGYGGSVLVPRPDHLDHRAAESDHHVREIIISEPGCEQPLRHFFDDWPSRSRCTRDHEPITTSAAAFTSLISWGSAGAVAVDHEPEPAPAAELELKHSNSSEFNYQLSTSTTTPHAPTAPNNNNNNTQLSMSIPSISAAPASSARDQLAPGSPTAAGWR